MLLFQGFKVSGSAPGPGVYTLDPDMKAKLEVK